MSQESNVDPLFELILFPALDVRGDGSAAEGRMPDPCGDFFAKAAEERWLAKNGSANRDPGWDELVGAAPRVQLSKSFLWNSEQRLERAAAKIRNFCGLTHEEEAAEIVKLAEAMRDAVRQEFIEA